MPNERPADSQESASSLERHTVLAADVKQRRPQWLDSRIGRGWIPKTGLAVLAGMQGLGKSTLAAGIAADVSQRANVLIFSAEDDHGESLAPRVQEAGADLQRIRFERPLSNISLPSDISLLHKLVTEWKPRLVVFDPLIAYVDNDTNSWKDQDVRKVQRALYAVATERKFAALGVMHPPKGKHSDPIHALVGGSMAWTAGPRSVLGLALVDDELVLVHAKTNFEQQESKLLRRDIVKRAPGWTVPVINVVGTSPVTLADLYAPAERPSPERDKAKGFLLAHVPTDGIDVADIKDMADGYGHAWKTVQRAKEETPEIEVYWESDPAAKKGRRFRWRRISLPEY